MSRSADPQQIARVFADAVAAMPTERPIAILAHFDADGLGAVAILARALDRAGRTRRIRLVGKGETPWSAEVASELHADPPGGLLVADLGVREGSVLPGMPTVFIDHHVPTGVPGDALVISGNGCVPEPTSALIAYWCAQGLGPAEDLLWLAAIGLIGDMAEDRGFPELSEAQARFGKTALRDAVSLINAPRRTAAADASPALALLMRCNGPKELLSGFHSETALLRAAKDEVKAAMDQARRIAPKVRGDVALIALNSPCQIHPLIAQQWRGRMKGKVVIAANRAYRPGWVHFAARAGGETDLIRFLAERRPPGADAHYGSGHRAASGGALRLPDWNAFIAGLGFPEEQIAS
jgi:single-stranded-DNA-specific exonuclease